MLAAIIPAIQKSRLRVSVDNLNTFLDDMCKMKVVSHIPAAVKPPAIRRGGNNRAVEEEADLIDNRNISLDTIIIQGSIGIE